jgi:murein tripeptide amidase MpaA
MPVAAVPRAGARRRRGSARRGRLPAADAGYHSYDEVLSEVAKVEGAHPSLVRRFSIGRSWEGREIQAVKLSDNVAVDEAEPEVLFDAGQHAREHLSIEMAMYLLDELTGSYAGDARIRAAVDRREIWIVPNLNPDGSEYHIASASGYRSWRKNRQPNPGSDEIGTDLNRNRGYRWGCCGGSSSAPGSEDFRGASAFAAPQRSACTTSSCRAAPAACSRSRPRSTGAT